MEEEPEFIDMNDPPRAVEDPSHLEDLLYKLVDPEMPLYFKEREEAARIIQWLMAEREDSRMAFEEAWTTSVEYGSALKNSVGKEAKNLLPSWLWEEVKDGVELNFDCPSLLVTHPVESPQNLSQMEKRAEKIAGVECTYSDLKCKVQQRTMGFKFDNRAQREEAARKLKEAGFLVREEG